MSDSGAASSNSWTLLSQEENVATLRPLAEGTEHHGDSSGNAESQPPEGATLAKTEHPAEDQQASEEHMAGQCEVESSPGPTSDPSPALIRASETPPPPPSLVIPAHSLHGGDAHSQSEGLPEGPVVSSPEPDSFSDSYTHISPSSPDEPPVPELLGGLELREEEEVAADRPGSEEEGSEQVPRPPKSGSSVDPQVGEERGREDMEAEEEAKVRRRSLLASLEHIGRREEEEEEEEEEGEAEREAARFPRRNEDSGFSVNKCILGAVILLGLGTIFFSGVFMDLDEENDAQYTQRELRDTEQPVNQEWLKPEAPPQAAVDVGPEVLNMLVKETQQIAELAAKAQAQKQELNAAKGQAAEGAQEQLRKKEEEEVQEENVNAASSLPPVTATTTTAPPAVQERDSRPQGQAKKVEKPKEGKKEKHDTGEQERKWEQKEARDQAKTQHKEEEPTRPEHQWQEHRSKEAKGRKPKEERKEGKEQGEGRKDKGHRGDEGEPWKDRGAKEERREEKEWKKGKSDKLESSRGSERKGHEKEAQEAKDRGRRTEWRGKEEEEEEEEERQDWKVEKDWRRGKEEKEWKKGKEEKELKKGKEEKEWKKEKEEKEWKKGKEEKELKKGKEEKEWKKGKEEKEWKKGKEEKELKKGKEEKEWRRGQEEKEWGRGEEERTDRKKEREWKKGKLEKSESHREKERRGHDEEEGRRRDGKGRREHGEWRQEKEEEEEERKKGEGAWKKGRESGKAWKQEQREQREKGEPKEWRRDSDERRGKHHGDRGRERRWGGEEQREDHPQGGGDKKEARKQEWKDGDRTNDGRRISRREEDVADRKKPEERHYDHQHHQHHHKESVWQGPGDGQPTHTHARRRPAFGRPDYWPHQRERLRQNALPSRHCSGVEACARAQGTLPVQLAEFQAVLAGYVARAEEEAGVDASAGEELHRLAAEFFKDGVFAHDQMSFRDYVEDVADILEDMVDRDEGEEEEQEDDSDLEDEMEMFGKEVMKRFAVEGSSEKEWKTGKSKKETERSRG